MNHYIKEPRINLKSRHCEQSEALKWQGATLNSSAGPTGLNTWMYSVIKSVQESMSYGLPRRSSPRNDITNQRLVKYLVVLCVATLLAGCIGGETKPSSFYYLSATEVSQSDNIVHSGGVSLRLGPFSFPDYLHRPNIITRSTDNKMVVNEFHRWAGSLEDDFHRALGANLGGLLQTGTISVYPADSRIQAKYVVQGELNVFEGTLGEKVILDTRWFVLDRVTEENLASRQSVIIEQIDGDDYSALVSAQSRAVGKLSREIAEELRRLDEMK